MPACPAMETDRRQPRDCSFRRQPKRPVQQLPQYGSLCEEVGKARRDGSQSRSSVNSSKGVRLQRPPPVFIIVREKLRLVCRNIHICRALGLAGFARQTQIQRLLDVFIFPAVTYDLSLEQLKEQVRAPPRAVLFFSTCHITGAHRSAIALSARPQSTAAQPGFRTRGVVLATLQVRL